MADDVEIVVLYDKLPAIAAALPDVVSGLVRKAAFDIAAWAIAAAPIKTGFLAGSIYVVTGGGASAENKYPYSNIKPPETPDAYALPEVEAPSSPTEAIVAVAANYGVYVEFGTVKMGAQPYLTPAAEAIRPALEAALSSLETYLKALVEGL